MSEIMDYKIYQNGKEVSGQIPIGLMRTEAAGIFESMRAYQGRILHEEDHLARLRAMFTPAGAR